MEMATPLKTSKTLKFTTSQLELSFQVVKEHLCLKQISVEGFSWLNSAIYSGLFAFQANGERVDISKLTFERVQEDSSESGVQHLILSFSGKGLNVDYHLKLHEDTALIESWPVIHNSGTESFLLERMDSLVLSLRAGGADLLSFTADWGTEFEPVSNPLSGEVILESRSGRSSKGNHPWFALFHHENRVLSGAVAWSGNWVIRFEPLEDGQGHQLSMGLHDWEFAKILQPGEAMSGVPVVLAAGDDLDDVSQQYVRVGRKHWYPENAFAAQVPIEWNHWWPYEDAEIHEEVFLKNVEKAEGMGFEICTLDAGWFGPSDPGTHWYDVRGDWQRVNQERFPRGIRKLADEVHARKMRFGIWCEIEALGTHAQLTQDLPELVARRDGVPLGYLCFGNPQAQARAFETLARLISEYTSDWIKLDFNLDPGAGCNRTDHGHQAGDGLYEHYLGYYRVLERVRQTFPDVVLESCSSGGLRIDLGLLRRTDMTFLSDPDYPVHGLQVFWGASTMLAPNVLLHWAFSQWRDLGPPPFQNFKPNDPNLTRKKWDYYSRVAMLGVYGLSQKLPDLPAWLAQRIVENNQIYKNHVRRFVKEADLYRLTGQPRRTGEGDRWAAFQYSLPDAQHLLFVFRLPGAEPERAIRLKALEKHRLYQIQGLEGEGSFQMTGQKLIEEGITFSTLEEEESALLMIS
jgi:alpha-galactosidase